MKKPYHAHEIVYQHMKEKGALVWGQKGSGSTGKSSYPETNAFLKEALSQPYAPKSGRIIELGCGTGPILRKVCKKGFTGLGIDISKTAIELANQQTNSPEIEFQQGDACDLDHSIGKFDIAIDGLCFHCITDTADRKAYLDNIFKILNPGGLFILLTMSGPVNLKLFEQYYPDQKLIENVIYNPFENHDYSCLKNINGKTYIPTRYIADPNDILTELRAAGLEPKLIKHKPGAKKESTSTLMTACTKIEAD